MKKKSNSGLPSDFFTGSLGSNYGLDGFTHTEDYGSALEESQLTKKMGIELEFDQPQSKKEVFFEEGLDLSDTELTDRDPLSNIEWLEFVEQDPDRLPDLPHERMTSELQDAWFDGRTDGVNLVPNNQKRPTVEKRQSKHASRKKMELESQKMIREATRRKKSLDLLMERKIPQTIKNKVASEYGLLGNVFIRASAYPKCAQGNWKKDIQKYASKSRYVIEKTACGGCTQNKEGRCQVFKKDLVKDVPWTEAYGWFESKLALDHNIKGKKKRLKEAFLRKDPGPQYAKSFKPQMYLESNMTFKQAAQELKKADKNPKVLKKASLEDFMKRKAQAYVKKLQERSLISKKAAKEVLKIQDPGAMIKEASSRVDLIHTAKYQDQGVSTHLMNKEASFSKRDESFFMKKGMDYLSTLKSSGMLDKKEFKAFSSVLQKSGYAQMSKLANALVNKKMSVVSGFHLGDPETRERFASKVASTKAEKKAMFSEKKACNPVEEMQLGQDLGFTFKTEKQAKKQVDLEFGGWEIK